MAETQNSTNASECPYCKSGGAFEMAQCTDHMVSGERFRLYRCPDCSLVYTVLNNSGVEPGTYDKVQYRITLGDKPRGLLRRLYHVARSIMLRRKLKLITRITGRKGGRLLNYGAAIGYFSSIMEDHNWKVVSIERSHEERQFSLEMFHHRMMDEDAMNKLRKGTFDVATLWHVLGNRKNITELIDRLYDLLTPNGILFVAAPNSASLDAAHYADEWAGWDVPRHIWHMNPSLIQKVAKEHGFVMMHRERLPFDVFYICILSERNLHHIFPITRGLVRGLYYHLKSIGHVDRSSSLVYVFRKIERPRKRRRSASASAKTE
ncbi:MAG: methyltransferase domain-containing protein [Bacteroidaceae bacterium]|nr:methyltransferase domain-containing protein [Bacteroidaceae bacterium]